MFAAALTLGGGWFLAGYEVAPVLQIGNMSFDVPFVTVSAIGSLVVAVASIWLSRCISGARALINLSRLGD